MSGEDILRSDWTDQTIDKSGSTVESLKEGISTASSKLQEAAARKSEELKAQGQDIISRQKEEIANRISGIGSSVRRVADKLREADDTMLADTTEGIASRIEGASIYVREREIGEVLRDVEDFTRRHSTLVLGGLFLGGIALARFLKASRPVGPELEPARDQMLFDEDEDLDLGGNIYEEPRFDETPLGEARFGGVESRDQGFDMRGSGTGYEGAGLGRPDGLEAEGFPNDQSRGTMPESDIGSFDQSEIGVNVGRTQEAPPVNPTSSSSTLEQKPDEGLDDRDPSGRRF